jgi:hypothetical protein
MFYVSLKFCNRINLVCFLKFVVHKINSEIVKSQIMVVTERQKTNVTDMTVI